MYVAITDDTSTQSCNVTLSQLINLLNSTESDNESIICFLIISKKIELQSDIIASGNETFVDSKLSFKNFSTIIINGQTNETFNCEEVFTFEFVDVSFVEVKSIHFDNCHSGVSFTSMHVLYAHSVTRNGFS